MRGFVAAATLVLVLVSFSPSPAQDTLQVKGVVFNGTTGRTVRPGLAVEIGVVGPDGGRIDVARAKVRERGGFDAEVAFEPGARTVVSTRFAGITYSTIARAGTMVARAELRVFETSRDTGVLSVDADTTVVERAGPGQLEVLSIVRMSNGSNRTFIGRENDAAVFELPLPDGATDVAVVEGLTPGRSEPDDGGLGAGDPLQPGEATISYAYKLGADEDVWSFSRRALYPTQRLDVLVEPEMELSGADLEAIGEIDFGGESYRQYVVNDLHAGTSLEFTVATPAGTGVWPIAAGAAALFALGSLAWRMGRRRARTSAPIASPSRELDRENLIQEIAALDLSFEAGDVADADYQTRRRALKERLSRRP